MAANFGNTLCFLTSWTSWNFTLSSRHINLWMKIHWGTISSGYSFSHPNVTVKIIKEVKIVGCPRRTWQTTLVTRFIANKVIKMYENRVSWSQRWNSFFQKLVFSSPQLAVEWSFLVSDSRVEQRNVWEFFEFVLKKHFHLRHDETFGLVKL